MADTIRHFEQQTPSTMCSVLYQVVHPKIKFHIHTEQCCDRLKFETSAAQKKKARLKKERRRRRRRKKKKKTHLGQVFQSVTSFET